MTAPQDHLESDVCDIADMALVCSHLSDDFQDQLIALADMGMSGKQATEQAQRTSAMLVFAVHLQCMARALREKVTEGKLIGPNVRVATRATITARRVRARREVIASI
jgi:hypothetical protein